MSELKKKLDRIRRIHSLESNQLSVLIGDLARIDAELAAQREHLADLEQMKEQGLATTHRFSVELLAQNAVWVDSVSRSIALASEIVAQHEAEREDANARLLDQRTRVRGLEILMDQLTLDIDAELQNREMLVADEQALEKYARN